MSTLKDDVKVIAEAQVRMGQEIDLLFLKSCSSKFQVLRNGNEYYLRRKEGFRWVWLDVCDAWCNWYGKENPKVFYNLHDVVLYLKNQGTVEAKYTVIN